MAITRLNLNEFDEPDYELIAIHTPLEDYRLAFFLNRTLNIALSANPAGVPVITQKGESVFSRFTYVDNDQFVWELLQNKTELLTGELPTQDLFGEPSANLRAYLLPEFKTVDYLLKIDAWLMSRMQIVEVLADIEPIVAAYVIDQERVKSQNNLILLEHANIQKDKNRRDTWAGR